VRKARPDLGEIARPVDFARGEVDVLARLVDEQIDQQRDGREKQGADQRQARTDREAGVDGVEHAAIPAIRTGGPYPAASYD